MHEHGRATQRFERHLLAIDRHARESQRLAHALQPTGRPPSLPRGNRFRKILDDRGIAIERLPLLAGEFVGNAHLQHRLGRIGRGGILGNESLQLLDPGSLHLVDIDARLLHVGGIPSLRQAKHDKPGQRLIRSHRRGQLLQLGSAIGERAVLHTGSQRLRVLPHPERPLGGVGSLDNLPEDRHLLLGQLLAAVGIGGSELRLQIA